jgi:hypothetical protein
MLSAIACGGGSSSSPSTVTTPAPTGGYTVVSGDLARAGGVGSSIGTAFTSQCSSGEVVIGLSVRAGGRLDALAPVCGLVKPDGSTSAAHTLSMVGGGGGTPLTETCPPGQAVVGMLGRGNSTTMEAVSFQCAALPSWVASGTLGQVSSQYGGGELPTFAHSCPQGYAVNMLQGTADAFVTGLVTTCVRVRSGS